jgi:hypothetical protein
MTTNTFTPKNMSAGNLQPKAHKIISVTQIRSVWAAIFAKSSAFLSQVDEAWQALKGTDTNIDIASTYYVRAGNQTVSRAMGHAYIESEAALMQMKQQRIMM